MERVKRLWQGLRNFDARVVLILFAAYLALTLTSVIDSWTSRYAAESDASVLAQKEELRKHRLASEHDRNALDKERQDFGLDAPRTEGLDKLGELFIRVGPYALLFFTIARAWKVFDDPRSSRLRISLAVSFSVIVVGFVLVVGGYVAPTGLNLGLGSQQMKVTSESLGIVVIAIGAAMFIASFASFRKNATEPSKDEA